MYRYGISSQRRSWPLWMTILIFLGVMLILGVIIGLLVHFLAVGKTYYYQGDFHISGVTYNHSCEKAVSQTGTDLSKAIETKMSDAFQNSSVYKEYINSQVIKFLPYPNGSRVQFQLTLKFPPAKKNSMKTKIKGILHQMLKDNMASWNAVPSSIKLTETSKANAEMLTNNCINGVSIVHMGLYREYYMMPCEIQISMRQSLYLQEFFNMLKETGIILDIYKKNNSEDWTVNFGTLVNKPYMRRKVQNIIFHENYTKAGVHDDIALVQLAEDVSFTKYVRKICLPEAKMKLSENDSVVVTGWGTLYMNGPLPVILRQAVLKIIDNEVCNAPHALSGLVTDTMLCAGFMSGETDACQNDSGGPLAYPDSRNIWHLVGIVSWGEGCGKKNKPGVYTRVSAYRDWITSKTGL